MLYHSYLKNGVVYIPTVARLTTGAYVDVDPVTVESVANTDGLRRSLSDTLSRNNAAISPPPKDKWPPPVLLKHAGVKSWSVFARGASMWSIKADNGSYQIIAYRDHPDGYWTPDQDQSISFPSGTSADVVIDRMIAILQDAARQPNSS
jgi:hypothetical protein